MLMEEVSCHNSFLSIHPQYSHMWISILGLISYPTTDFHPLSTKSPAPNTYILYTLLWLSTISLTAGLDSYLYISMLSLEPYRMGQSIHSLWLSWVDALYGFAKKASNGYFPMMNSSYCCTIPTVIICVLYNSILMCCSCHLSWRWFSEIQSLVWNSAGLDFSLFHTWISNLQVFPCSPMCVKPDLTFDLCFGYMNIKSQIWDLNILLL